MSTTRTIAVTASVTATLTIALSQLVSPAGAGSNDSEYLRQIRNSLTSTGQIHQDLNRIKSQQAQMCRAIAAKSYDCPIP